MQDIVSQIYFTERAYGIKRNCKRISNEVCEITMRGPHLQLWGSWAVSVTTILVYGSSLFPHASVSLT
jgi:hypothetical protein